MREKQAERHEKILLSLEMLGFLTRDQITKLHNLGKKRNTNRILKDMEPYLNSLFDKQKVYYLNKKGAERIGSIKKLLTQSMNYQHTLMRNELYIYFNQPQHWYPEWPIEWGKNKIIVDVFMKGKNHNYFIEIDNTQTMAENRKKIEKYKQLKGTQLVQNKMNQFPVLVFVTKTSIRKQRLDKICKTLELEHRVFLLDDIH